MAARRWTAREVEIIDRAWPNIPEIMLRTRRGENSVRMKAKEMGLTITAKGHEYDRNPRQIQKWPADMPRFEDHPDADSDREPRMGYVPAPRNREVASPGCAALMMVEAGG